jgi:alpha-aminoadipate carrier protein LysW
VAGLKVECPECLALIEVPDDVVVGEVLDCPECGVELEVYEVGEGGVKVRVSEVLDEDWGE